MRSSFQAALLAQIGFVCAFAQQPAAAPAPPLPERPSLFLKEDWKLAPTPGGVPVTQANVISPNLELKLYGDGPGGTNPDHGVWLFQRAQPKDDPTYIWTGRCNASCGIALSDKDNFVDLSGLGKIKWRTMQAGFHLLRPLVRLADGTWLVGDHADGYTADWHESEITLSEIRWRQLDIKTVLTTGNGQWVNHPDLTKVDEIGFTDLMQGSGNGAGGATRLDWIESTANPSNDNASHQPRFPEPGEYNPAFAGYMEKARPFDDPAVKLALQADELLALLQGLTPGQHLYRYAPGKWSIQELLAHVTDTERIFAYRLLRIARGDSTPLAGFDENAYAAAAEAENAGWDELVEEFSSVRRASILMLRHLPQSAWVRTGVVNGAPLSTRAMAYIMAGHVKHHIGILRTRYLY